MLDSGFIFENPRRRVAVLDVGKSIIGNWKLKPETGNFSGNRFTDNRITTLITMLVSADCYLLCIMMALDTEIMFFLIWTDDTNFCYIQTWHTCWQRCV